MVVDFGTSLVTNNSVEWLKPQPAFFSKLTVSVKLVFVVWFKNFISVGDNSQSSDCISKCPNDCEETTYDYTSSYISLFSRNTVESLTMQLDYADRLFTNNDYDDYGQPLETPAINLTEDFLKDNIVGVEIGYSHFYVESAVSSPDQTFSSFVSNIGGLLGLVAGISFLTIYEFIEYPFIKLFSMFNNKQTHPEPRRHVVAGFQGSHGNGKYPHTVYPTAYYRTNDLT